MRASRFWPRWEAPIAIASERNVWESGSRSGRSHRILFGRVQEDTSLEGSFASGARALCIGSGGETAFDLLLGGAKEVVAIDINPAQASLVRLKSAIFRGLPGSEVRHALEKDARPAFAKLKDNLDAGTRSQFEARPQDLAGGLNHSGKIDQDLRRAIGLFQKLVLPKRHIEALLGRATVAEQAETYRAHWNSGRVRLGLKWAFSPFVLNRVFGKQFGVMPPVEFGEQVRRELETVLTTVPAKDNPFVWQTFLGRYSDEGLPPWLKPFGLSRMPLVISRLGVEVGDAGDWMLAQPEPTLNLVCLSNIFEGASDQQVEKLVAGLEQAATPGARVIARSLWEAPIGLDRKSAGRLKREPTPEWTDRSLFCRNVEIYRWSTN